jgi:hypothetical protein
MGYELLTAATVRRTSTNTWTASQTFNDSVKLLLGTGADAEFYYDATDLIIDVNSGDIKVTIAGGDFIFQQATTISTSSSNLTLSPASGVIITSAFTLAAANPSFKINATSGDSYFEFHEAGSLRYYYSYSASNDRFALNTFSDGGDPTGAHDIWRINDGQLSIDAASTWDDNVFDDYDDALVLSPYRGGVLNLRQRKEQLIQMGVLKSYEDGWVGYNDQRMSALLAGGIYQNRAFLDGLDKRIIALEAK